MSEEFNDELARLVRREVSLAGNDMERIAAMIESLLRSAGVTVALVCGGDRKAMNTLLSGCDGYLYESASEHVEISKMLLRYGVGNDQARGSSEGDL